MLQTCEEKVTKSGKNVAKNVRLVKKKQRTSDKYDKIEKKVKKMTKSN